jgi:hypothetical protein
MPDLFSCPRCGTPLEPADAACRNCGAAIPPTQMPSPQELLKTAGAAQPDPLLTELQETLAPNYVLLRELGRGGMGVVYLAREPSLRRLVVVKVLAPELATDQVARERFAREAASAAAVAHPNVVGVFQVGELPRSATSFFVMQFVEGKTLAEEFPEGTVAPESRVRRVAVEIGSALAAAHARGLVHRDIKPANIMTDAASERSIVLDFGVSAAVTPAARAGGAKLTQQGMSLGTPTYMSPEQGSAEAVTEKSDVYSLGCLLFELATGRPPFQATTPLAMLAAHLQQPPPPVLSVRPDLEPELARLIDACLVKEPAKRPSATDLVRALAPGQQREVPWPPPGLEDLRERGRTVLRLVRWISVVTVLFYLFGWLQPTVATAGWGRGETTLFWRGLLAPYLFLEYRYTQFLDCYYLRESGVFDAGCGAFGHGVDPTPVWFLLLVGFAIGYLVLVVRLVRQSAWLGVAWRRARRTGYPATLIRLVAADPFRDTGALLNGVGALALEPQAVRHARLHARHRALVWEIGLYVASIAVGVVWFAGVLPRLRGSGITWLSAPEWLIIALPLLAGLALAVRRGVIGRPSRRRRAVTARGELVAGWLADAPEAVMTCPGWSAQPLSWAGAAVVVFAGGIALLWLVGWMTGFTLWSSRTVRDWGRDWETSVLGPDSARLRWSGIDSALAEFAARPDRSRSADGDVRVLISRPAPDPGPELWTAWDSFPKPLPASLRRGLEKIASQPPPEAWRRVATAGATSDLIALVGSAPRPYWGLRTWAHRNAARELLAFDAGDRSALRRRIAENVAVGRYFANSASFFGHRVGVDILMTNLGLLTRYAGAIGDTLSVRRATEVRARLQAYQLHNRFFLTLGLDVALMADPTTPVGLAAVGRAAVAPGIRRRLALSAADGYCYNGREILAGIDRDRFALLDSVLVLTRDVPGLRAAVEAKIAKLRSAPVAGRSVAAALSRLQACGGMFGTVNSAWVAW